MIVVNPNTSFKGDGRMYVGYHPGVTRAVGENIGPVSNWGAFWAVANSGHGWELINLDGIEAEIPRPLVQYDNEGNKVFDF